MKNRELKTGQTIDPTGILETLLLLRQLLTYRSRPLWCETLCLGSVNLRSLQSAAVSRIKEPAVGNNRTDTLDGI